MHKQVLRVISNIFQPLLEKTTILQVVQRKRIMQITNSQTMDFLNNLFCKRQAFSTQGTHGRLWVVEDPQNLTLKILGATLSLWGC